MRKAITDEPVYVYLQGQSALGFTSIDHEKLTAWIGHQSSNMVVHDYRKKTIRGYRSLAGTDKGQGVDFGDIFNNDALCTVQYKGVKNLKLEISLKDKPMFSKRPKKLLYLGTIWDNTFPALHIIWENFKGVKIDGKEVIAFCALIKK